MHGLLLDNVIWILFVYALFNIDVFDICCPRFINRVYLCCFCLLYMLLCMLCLMMLLDWQFVYNCVLLICVVSLKTGLCFVRWLWYLCKQYIYIADEIYIYIYILFVWLCWHVIGLCLYVCLMILFVLLMYVCITC